MPTRKKPRFGGYAAGARKPSAPLRKTKEIKLGPGLSELEQLAGKAFNRAKTVEEMALAAQVMTTARAFKKLEAEEAGASAVANPRPIPKRKQAIQTATWNHRIVRRHSTHGTWLEITEVHYRKGKPTMFAIQMGTPSATLKNGYEEVSEPEAIQSLRWTLDHMLTALSQPILDEKADF